jgi:hypothetical protein
MLQNLLRVAAYRCDHMAAIDGFGQDLRADETGGSY